METDNARRPGAGTRVAAVVVGLAVAGVLAGLAWWWLWEPSYYVVSEGQGAMAEPDLARRFAADGWFGVVGAVGGLVSGLLVTWRFRSHRILSLVALVAGSFVATATMSLTGMLLGPGDTDSALAAAAEGARVPVELAVTVPAFYLAWPVAALFAACAVLWGGSDPPPVVHRTPTEPANRLAPWGPPGYPPHDGAAPLRHESR